MIDDAQNKRFTIASQQHDYVAWHRGRTHYAIWAIKVDVPDIRQWVDRARTHLQAHLLASYLRQPHITLAIGGFPALQQVKSNDNYIQHHFERDIAALQQAGIVPFHLTFGALFSFTMAACFAVSEHEHLLGLRAALTNDKPHIGDPARYVPHLTIGLYRHRVAIQQVNALMAEFEQVPLCIKVEKVCLLAYEAAVISGPLSMIGEFDLAASAFRICNPELLPWLASV